MKSKIYLSLAVLVAVFFCILFPSHFFPTPFPYFDKVAHFTASGMAFIALTIFFSERKSVLFAIILLTGTELIQLYIPARGASLGDALANIGGILGFWFLYSNAWLTSKLKTIRILPS